MTLNPLNAEAQYEQTKLFMNNQSIELTLNYLLVTRSLSGLLGEDNGLIKSSINPLGCFFFYHLLVPNIKGENEKLYYVCYKSCYGTIVRELVTEQSLKKCYSTLCNVTFGFCIDATSFLIAMTSRKWWLAGSPQCPTQDFFFGLTSNTFETLDPRFNQSNQGKKKIMRNFFENHAVFTITFAYLTIDANGMITFHDPKLILYTNINYVQIKDLCGGADIQRLMQSINIRQGERFNGSLDDPLVKWRGDLKGKEPVSKDAKKRKTY